MSALSATARTAVEAYGGADRWRSAQHVRACISADGLAFTLKRRPGFDRCRFAGEVHRPFARLSGIGKRPGVSGQLRGPDVELLDTTGAVIERRDAARQYFPFGRRAFWWDDLDMAYFACYAFWNYFTLPALLMNPDVGWTELAPGHLRAEFPAHIPTHSPVQHFRFDPDTGRLLRHDYTAEVIAPMARPANVVLRHAEQGGLIFPSERRVTPVGFGSRPLPFPALIRIRVHEYALL